MFRVVVLLVLMLQILGTTAMAETVRIAYPKLPAFIAERDGKVVGPFAEILQAAAAREDIKLTFVPLTSSPATMLANGSADAIAPFLIVEHSSEYDFGAMSGKTVATPSFGPFVSFMQQKFPGVVVLKTASYQETLDDVLGGRADAAALNIDEGEQVVAQAYAGKISAPGTPFMRESLGVAFPKGRGAATLQRLDAGMASIHADGTFERILRESKER
ncbi:MAG TPA: transporter substrate-binding domain-containing protein [Candidatus Baltobacteraceae bacterium]